MQKIVGSNPGTGNFLFLSFMFTDTWTCTFNVCTWYVHGLNKYVLEHACEYMFVPVYTWSEHVWTKIYEFWCMYMSVHGSSRFILVQIMNMMQTFSLLLVFPWGMPFELACTAFEIGMYYAIVQESLILYRQGSYRYIPPKNGLARWSAFL